MSEYLENRYALFRPNINMTRENWFVIPDNHRIDPIRRTLYKAEDGSVVAYQDSNNNILHVEQTFFDLYEHEPEFEAIMDDCLVYSKDKMHFFNMH